MVSEDYYSSVVKHTTHSNNNNINNNNNNDNEPIRKTNKQHYNGNPNGFPSSDVIIYTSDVYSTRMHLDT